MSDTISPDGVKTVSDAGYKQPRPAVGLFLVFFPGRDRQPTTRRKQGVRWEKMLLDIKLLYYLDEETQSKMRNRASRVGVCLKKPFANAEEAISRARAIENRHADHRFRVYKCWCGAWHLTKKGVRDEHQTTG